MIVKRLLTVLKSVIKIGLVLLLIYFLVQPDPKGIRFGVFLTVFGVISSMCGLVLFFFKSIKKSEFHYLIMTANLVNVYISIITAISFVKEFYLSPWLAVNLVVLVGACMSIYMLYQLVLKNSD